MLACLFATGNARAAVEAPVLTGTNPVSPGTALEPLIQGEIPDEGGTKVVALRLVPTGPVTKAGIPTNTVRLYTDAACSVLAGEGDVGELEDLGIQVSAPVEEDDITIFFAKQFDPLEGPSGCSAQGRPYRHVTGPPEAPVFESVSPASPANQNSPRLIGIADPEATVSVFSGTDCEGTAVASGSGTQFGGAGIEVSVPDNSETTFSARASFAGFQSACSATPISYQEVTPPPATGGGDNGGGGGVSPGKPVSPPPAPRLRTIPGGWANDNTPVLTGSAPGATTVRIYADPKCGGNPVAKVSAGELDAGVPVRVVDNDVTVFSAESDNGKASPCSEPVIYVEDSLTPRTRFTMAPGAKTAKRKAVLRFMDTTGNAPGTTFLCRVDKRKWKRCASPLRLRNLKLKRYVVQVKATDPAGNIEARGAKRSFKVITRP